MVPRQFTFLPSNGSQRAKTGDDGRTCEYSHWIRYNTFYGLAITTTLASLLLAADFFQWRATGYFFRVVSDFPASVALFVQMLAAFFGLIHVAVVCRLINFALRIRLTRESVTLDVLRTWVDMSIPRVDWDLPLRFFFPVAFIVFLSLLPAALWAGSMTPLLSPSMTTMTLNTPSYRDVSMIKEYPLEIGKGGPSKRLAKGLFTYSVGVQHIGSILSSAASASTVGKNSRSRTHPKFDNTPFSYKGRSYGVGAPVGLTDISISSNRQAASYIYQEEGYLTDVECIYNSTSNFTLSSGPVSGEWIYAASGQLPDSVDGGEYSNYIGHDSKAIVAMAVAYSEKSTRRYLAITAGESYSFLNNTQCEFNFTPTVFNVSVDLLNFNISVSPLNTVPDFNPQRNLTRTMVRQFELISNDLTNLYVSLLGDALNSSVAAYNMSQPNSNRNGFTQAEATLGGVTNSIIAMADDMLVAYASAQLIVGGVWSTQSAQVYMNAIRFGQPAYIYAIFGLNLCIMLAVAVEAVRTRGWEKLGRFNYLDPRDLIMAASRGGHEVAQAGDKLAREEGKKTMKRVWLLSDPDEGNGTLAVRMQGDDNGHVSIVLAGENSTPVAHLDDAEEPYVRRPEKGGTETPKKWKQRRGIGMFNFI